jgi:hypothetical protein
MSEKITIHSENHTELSAIHSRPFEALISGLNQTLIVLVHDIPGQKSGTNGLLSDLESLLSEKGYHSLRFDFRGFGQSGGESSEITLSRAKADVEAVKAWAINNKYKKVLLIAEGVGATASLLSIDECVSAVGLLWPILDFRAYQHYLKEQDKRGQSAHNLSLLARSMNSINVAEMLKGLHLPCLVFQGKQDMRVGAEHYALLREHSNAERMEISAFYDGEAGLKQMNHRKQIFFQIQQFVEKYV